MLSRSLFRSLALLPWILLGIGCSDDKTGDGASLGGDETGATSEDPTSGGSTGAAFTPIPARGGILINRVEANSGVAVAIGRDGAWVDGSGRNAYLPARRDTLIRAYVDVPDDWVGRELEGRLRLTGGGVDKELSMKTTISADSRDADIASTFYWGVEAADVQPGLKYSVTLWEAAPGQEDAPDGEVPPVSPLAGPAFIGIEADPAKMRVVLVPIDYSFGDCNAVVDGAKWGPIFEQALLQQNPIEELELTVHAPYKISWDMTTFNGLSDLVSEMSQLRTAEGAPPNVYYYGFFDNCGACIGSDGGINSGCTVGLAADITGSAQSDAWGRAAAGQLKAKPEETFVHEIGHTQGRRHIECPGGNAAGVDPSYPYPGGEINVWGFGIRDYRLRHPKTNVDYMTYCGPNWVSDWQWNATYQRIKTLTSWDTADATPPEGGLLIGAIDAGQQRWWTVPGTLDDDEPRSATHAVDFVFADGTAPVAAKVSRRSEGSTINVVAPLPADFDARALQSLVLHAPEGDSVIEPDAVRLLHRPERLEAAN